MRYPQEIIPLMDHALTEIFVDRFQDAQLPDDTSIKVRPYNLGRKSNLRDLNPSDIDQLVSYVPCRFTLLNQHVQHQGTHDPLVARHS